MVHHPWFFVLLLLAGLGLALFPRRRRSNKERDPNANQQDRGH